MMNYWNSYSNFGSQWAGNAPFNMGWGLGMAFGIFMVILAIWSLVWKGLALWKAAHLDSRNWFIVLLVVNTAGILDILYLYHFSKKPDNWLHRLFKK